jgi:transposase
VKTRIGESVSEKLEYEPASFTVIETVRAKYACPDCHDGVVEAPVPPQAIEKGLAGEGLLAHVIVSKYVDHLPLYRLEQAAGHANSKTPSHRARIDRITRACLVWATKMVTVRGRMARSVQETQTRSDSLRVGGA